MSLLPGPAARLNNRTVGDKFRVLLRSTVSLPIIAFVILASSLVLHIRSLIDALRQVDHAHQVISAEQELLKLNVDMETGVRGFQYTGRSEFLQPYNESAQIVDSKFAALDQLISGDPHQKAELAIIRGSFERWELMAADAIARRDDPSIHDSDEDRYNQTLKAKASMDGIRKEYANFDSGAIRLRNQYSQKVRSRYLLVGVTSFLIAFAGGIGLSLLFRRYRRRAAILDAQEADRRRDENLRRMVWGVKDYAILMLDPEGRIATWNEGAERIKGYRAEEIIGRHFSKFYPAEEIVRDKPASELRIATEKGRYEEEGWRVRKDGTQYWANVLITALRDKNGRLSGFAKVILDIPAPKEMEMALLTSEALRRAIFNSANFSKIATDAKGVIQIFNVGAECMLGYKAADVVNKITPANISDPRELVARAEELSSELETPIAPGFEALVFKASRGIEDIYELTYIRKDGSRFPAIVSVTALRDPQDAIIGYLLIGTDNTARKRAEEELLKAGALQRAIFNSANFSSIATDANGVIQIFNVGAERMLGYPSTEVMNKLTPADMSDPLELIARAKALSTEFETLISPGFEALVFKASRGIEDIYELTYIRKNGSSFPAVMSVTALRDAQDAIIGYLLIGTDNSARKQAEKALRENSDLLRTIHLHSIVSVANRAGLIIDVNDTFCAISGYSREELLDRTHHIINSGVHSRAFWTGMWQSIASGKSWRGEICNRAKDGSLYWVDSIIVPFMDEGGQPTKFLSIRNDITAAKQHERQLREETDKAQVANRAKSDFPANMSHEIRTPMNAIIGMTRLALRKDPDPGQLNYLRKIDNAAQSLLSIINDILDYSKIEAGKMELEQISFSLDEVLNNLDDIVRHKAEQKSIDIVFSIARGTPRYLTGDPLRLGQILINLVNNAIKFTEKGAVAVEVKVEEGTGERRQLSFSVRDTGIGMTPEQMSTLFRSFNQADTSITRKYGGTGLGLAITKQLCELMHGTLSAQSIPNEGSTFLFTAIFGIATGGVPSQSGTRRSDLLKKSILIVDDSENARDVLIAMVRANGLFARAVASGEEALAAIAHAWETGHPFDLVLMDWRMPGIDGIEASRRIKTQPTVSRIPAILMVSAFEREEAMRGRANPGLDGFLIKPVNESVLIDAIATIFGVKPDSPDSQLRVVPGCFPPDLAGRRVLLVEDNEINRDLATELLSDLGIDVTIAVNGKDGVDRISAESFDLVLMDIQMPVMDGLTATKQIRANARFIELPILAMTAHAMSGDRNRSLDAGMNDHITKPIDPNNLMAALIRWMPNRLRKPRRDEVGLAVTTPCKTVDRVHPFPFDIRKALVRTNGKSSLLRRIMFGFRAKYASAGLDLRRLVADGETENAQRLAHSLKGTAATLEAKDLTEAASAVESAFRSGETKGLGLLIDALEQALAPAIAGVDSLNEMLAAFADPLD